MGLMGGYGMGGFYSLMEVVKGVCWLGMMGDL